MDATDLKIILQQFARQARAGQMITDVAERTAVADLAEQLGRRIDNAEKRRIIRSDTISFAPGRCPTCGK